MPFKKQYVNLNILILINQLMRNLKSLQKAVSDIVPTLFAPIRSAGSEYYQRNGE